MTQAVIRWLRPLVFIGALVAFFIGIIFISQSRRQIQSTGITESQLTEISESFPVFLANRLKKEKKDSRLIKVDIVSIKATKNGLVDVAYSILFDDPVAGHLTPSMVEATATLKYDRAIWRVLSVSTKRESIDFQD